MTQRLAMISILIPGGLHCGLEEAADFTTCEADILQSSYSLPIEETICFDKEATKTPQNPAKPLDWW